MGVAKKRPLLLLIASAVKESSASTENLWNKLNQNPCNSSSKNQSCFWARTDSQKSTLGSVLRVVAELHKSTLSDKPCPRPLSLIIKNSLTNKAKRPSRTCWSNTTEPYWLPIPEDASPRSSVVPVPGQDTKSLTVNALCFSVEKKNKTEKNPNHPKKKKKKRKKILNTQKKKKKKK